MTDHDFAEYVSAGVVSPCRFRLHERKHAVDHGVHGVHIDRALHRFHIDAAPDADAAERRLTHEKAHEIQTGIALRERTDDRDLATERHSLERLREGPGPSDLNDAIDASPGRQPAHSLRPLRVLNVVDNDIRADLLQPLAISISGVNLPAPITLNQAIYKGAGADFKQFRQDINQLRPGNKHHKGEIGEGGHGGHNHGLIFTALAEPEASFTYADPDFGMIPVPGLGKVYIAEWWAQPYWQNLTWLRVVLENAQDRLKPGSRFTGQIVVDDGDDGVSFPP